jgi:EmrB/QacA subfamily drug resistance transporter
MTGGIQMQDTTKNDSSRWLALLVVFIGTFMSTLDTSIVNIAISKMMAVFGVSLDDVKWVLTAYTLTLGAIVPITGYIGDLLGYKKLFLAALAIFTGGSLLCGFAWNNTAMIIFRIIQALGGGMIMPVGMTIVMQLFPPEERGTAVGFYGVAAMAAPAIGPTLGGYIIQSMDWRLIFYINVPIGILAVILGLLFLKETPRKPFTGFDNIGFISSTAGIVSLLYVLGESSTIDWSEIQNPLLIAFGCFSLVLFAVHELNHPDPVLELRILKIFDYSLSQIVQCILVFVLMGGMYVMPLFLQNLRGYTALESGLILFLPAIAQAFMMPISGKLFNKIGAKALSITGLIILAISSYILSFVNLDTGKSAIILIMTIRGVGLGIVMMPIVTIGMNAVSTDLAGKASAFNNMIKQIAMSLGVTVITTLMQTRTDMNYGRLSEQVTTFNPVASGIIPNIQGLLIQNGYSANQANAATVSALTGFVQKQAYVDAIDYALAVCTVTVLVALAVALFMRSRKKGGHRSAMPLSME